MLLPQLFSKRGRQALAAYAFLLALGGPARNSLHNLGVLSSSLACGQVGLWMRRGRYIDVQKDYRYELNLCNDIWLGDFEYELFL